MVEKVVRKKVAKKTTKKTTRKVATKKVATKRVAAKTAATASTRTTSRKAPTPIAQNNADMAYTRKVLIGGTIVFLVFLTISILIGFKGGGEISVSSEFQKSLESATPEERTAIENATKPPAPSNNRPLGGLVPANKGTNKPAPTPAPAPVDNASSTNETATSTDSNGEEVTSDEESLNQSGEGSTIDETEASGGGDATDTGSETSDTEPAGTENTNEQEVNAADPAI